MSKNQEIVARLRPRLRREREKLEEQYETEAIEGGELNLVPYLDIITNVIMFLLASVSMGAILGNVNVSLPQRARPGQTVQAANKPEESLNLTVAITGTGFQVAATGGVLPKIDKKGGAYDYAALTELLREVKKSEPNESKVILSANPDITYDVIIQVMDAMRGTGSEVLFPDVNLAAGIL
jgi:biopolymer transport protein ExbD